MTRQSYAIEFDLPEVTTRPSGLLVSCGESYRWVMAADVDSGVAGPWVVQENTRRKAAAEGEVASTEYETIEEATAAASEAVADDEQDRKARQALRRAMKD